MPEITVLLPVRDARDTLARAIDSILDQSFPDWELILFDDGSTDGSLAIAQAHARRDSRIRVVASDSVGLVEALRQASRLAKGQWLARMDADDVAHPERLQAQLALMRSDPRIALCGTRVQMVGERIGTGRRRYEAWINGLLTHDDIVRDLFVECPIPHPTFLMRRDAFQDAGGYRDSLWAEDYDLCLRFFLAGWRFAKTSEVLLDWRESAGRLSMTDPCYSPQSFRHLKRHYLFMSYLKDRPFHQWGAGEVGKEWLREWGRQRPRAVVDINPRKIGRTIHGCPVIAPEDLPPPGQTFTVVAVGAPGARDEIRQWMRPRAYRELNDYLFIA